MAIEWPTFGINNMKIILLLTFLFATAYANACTGVYHDDLDDKIKYIKNADLIQWVEVVGVNRKLYKTEYIFKNREVIKGDGVNRLLLATGESKMYPTLFNLSDFSNHISPLFWDKGVTDAYLTSECEITSNLNINKQYLLVSNGGNYKSYSFENVLSKSDKWYKFVTAVVMGKNYISILTVTEDELKSAAYSIDRYRIRKNNLIAPKIIEQGIMFDEYNLNRPSFRFSGYFYSNKEFVGYDLYHFSKNPFFQINIPFKETGERDFSFLRTTFRVVKE